MYININITNIIIYNDKNYLNKLINVYYKDKNINIYYIYCCFIDKIK